MKRITILLTFFSCFLFSCREENEPDPVSLNESNRQLFVLNEGNYNFGNASISHYDLGSRKLSQNIFHSNNQGRPIGDVVQSMEVIGGRGYIVVNNSSKIEVVNMKNFKSVGTISPLNSPRYILPIDSNLAYVSDLYEGKISIVNFKTLDVVGSISTGGWTEEMKLLEGKVFVCQMDSAQLLVIDPKSHQITNRIQSRHSPQHLEIDLNGMLWLSSSGGFSKDLSALQQIDPINERIVKSLAHSDSSLSIGEIEFNAAKDRLYYLQNGGLYSISIEDTVLSKQVFIPSNGRLFYGLGVNEQDDAIYLSDAIDYQQNGIIFQYDAHGNNSHSFRAGIIPGDFVFYP